MDCLMTAKDSWEFTKLVMKTMLRVHVVPSWVKFRLFNCSQSSSNNVACHRSAKVHDQWRVGETHATNETLLNLRAYAQHHMPNIDFEFVLVHVQKKSHKMLIFVDLRFSSPECRDYDNWSKGVTRGERRRKEDHRTRRDGGQALWQRWWEGYKWDW